MDKGEKNSPSPGNKNIFENAAASLLGVSPFGLPYAAHLAHMPSAFSLLGHHPAFPVSTLFGGLGEGSLGHLPTSLASSAGFPSWWPTPPTSLPSSHAQPNGLTFDLFLAGSIENALTTPHLSLELPPLNGVPSDSSAPKHDGATSDGETSLFNNAGTSKSKLLSSPSKSSSRSPNKVHRSSPSSKSSVSKATTAIASTSSTTLSNSNGQKSSSPSATHLVSGTSGVSLLSGKYRHSSKNSPTSTSSSHHRKAGTNGTLPSSHTKSSTLSSSLMSSEVLNNNIKQKYENGANLSDSDSQSDGSSEVSSLSSSATNKSKALDEQNNINHIDGDPDSPMKSSSPSIHIDGFKKKLIADQIRQRVQNKPIVSVKTSIMQPIKRGRGRPPKTSPDQETQSSEETPEKTKEDLKVSLEANLKQQQIQLKMLRKIQAEKEREDMLKAQQKQQKSHGTSSDQSKSTSVHKEKEIHGHKDKSKAETQRSLLFNSTNDALKPDFHKALLLSESKEKQHSSGKHIQVSPLKVPDLKMSITRSSPGEQLVAKFKTLSETSSDNQDDDLDNSDGDSNSDSDEDSDSDNSDSDDMEFKDRSSETGSVVSKRSADESSERGGTPTKRPRIQTDENVLRIPLEHGWTRRTTILAIGKRGFIGEVLYFAPCGKKLKTIPDVTRYLEKHNTDNLSKEHFSFSTRVKVGEFYEAQGEQNGLTRLNEQEIAQRMALIESKRQKMMRLKQQRGQKRKEKQDKQIQLAKQMMEQKLMRKMEQQGIQLQLEMARRAAEYKEQKRLEKLQERDMQQRIKHMRVIEKKKQKDQLRVMREQEKLQRQEQIRIERDMRAQQILEEREMKRQQAVLMKEQERERKRQHFILVKALEAQKKQAERDRLKEEKMAEKRMSKEKRMEQRRVELQFLRDLKRPEEDMELVDAKPIPDYPRIPGTQVDGNCLADLLMVLEFLHNFGDALGFDDETLPSMKSLQDGVTAKTEDDTEEYMSLVSHLMRYAVNDPGVPNPKEAVTRLGQKIGDLDISDAVVSEILRVFVIARNGGKNEMSDWLTHLPLEALNSTQKAAVLAFMCNELLCGKAITAEVDRHLDHMGDIRRDKWVVEGKLRRLRMIQAKKFRQIPKPPPDGDSSMTLLDGDDSMSVNISVSSKRGSEDEEEKDDESGNDSDDGHDTSTTNDPEGEMEEPASLEDCEKQIEKLQKQHAQYREKVFEASHKVRAINFGQDRYKRQYWVLPCAGGVYVEGLESGSFVSDEIADEQEQMEADNKSETLSVKQEMDESNNNDKQLNAVKTESCCTEVKVEDIERTNQKFEFHLPQNSSDINSVKTEVKDNEKMEVSFCNGEITPTKSEGVRAMSPSNLFLQTPTSTMLSELCNLSPSVKTEPEESKAVVSSAYSSLLYSPSSSSFLLSSSHTSTPNNISPSVSCSTPLMEQQLPKAVSSSSSSSVATTTATSSSSTTSTLSETKPKFLSIDSLLKKEDTPNTQSEHFFPSPVFPVLPLTPDQMLKNFGDLSEQKPWFSILPRMPCDDLSLTAGSGLIPTSPFSTSPFLSPLPFRAFPVQSPSFASFRMGQIFGTPSEYSVASSNSSSQVDNFKVPSTPRSETDTPSGLSLSESIDFCMKDIKQERQPIPEEMQKGWWRITDEEHLKTLSRCCHPRGIRERDLQKTLQKYMEFACESCGRGDKDIISMESSDSSSEEEEEDEEDQEGNKEKKEDDNGEDTTEKSKVKDSDKSDPEKMENNKKEKMEKKDIQISEDEKKLNLLKAGHQVELALLEEVENLEERVASASLQIKGWKVPQRVSEEADLKIVDRTHVELTENEFYPMEMARNKLLNLEPNIERRYMKPPLCKAVQINLASITANAINESRCDRSERSSENGEEEEREIIERPEDIPSGLATWRIAVATATSPAQLTLCVFQLNNAIAWEKSIMKVLCQICRKDDNEAMLLLCDGCDRGYHTYCFKPKMENIPDGDWYCYECISKATGEPCCIVCGKRMGRIVECAACPRAIHLDCLDPPLPRMPRKWFCQACIQNKGKKRTRRSPKKKQNENEPATRERLDSDSSSKPSTDITGSEKKKGKDMEKRKLAEQSDDMTMCRLILTEMEKHDDGWPFLKPVNFKQFPTYKKYIKHPMDFTTMKNKLRDNVYQTRSDFATDARLVFSNCQTFNEDESEVGRAGHSMRKFFDSRWKELLLSSTSNTEVNTDCSAPENTETEVTELEKEDTESKMES